MKTDYPLAIKININAQMPLHIGTGLGKGGVIDKSIIKDYEGNVYIPGSSLKGKIRHYYTVLYRSFINSSLHYGQTYCTFDNIEDCCAICQIFGSKYHQGRFTFFDAMLKDEEFSGFSQPAKITDKNFQFFQVSVRQHNKISRKRKVAEEKHLFASEATMPGFQYKSVIDGILTVESNLSPFPKEALLLIASLKMINKIGGGKSRGLGKIQVDIESINNQPENISELVALLDGEHS
jgi:CRISPR-associated protein Csm3